MVTDIYTPLLTQWLGSQGSGASHTYTNTHIFFTNPSSVNRHIIIPYNLFLFCGSLQDYKIHMDMEIVEYETVKIKTNFVKFCTR
jgi:hypothetical protein